MERILWVGDAVVPTGFARVTHSILDRLKDKYEFSVLGVNHYGDPHPHEYDVYPAFLTGEPYGFERVSTLVERLKPDIVVLFNDTWIIDSYLRAMKQANLDFSKFKVVVYFPVDHTNLDPRYFTNYDVVDSIATYTSFGVDVFKTSVSKLDSKGKKFNINIIPHGVDLETFFEIDQEKIRRELSEPDGLDEFLNSFVVFNANRNSPRKRYDIFLRAFHEFSKDKKDTRVYCHCGLLDQGIDIVRFAVDYGFKPKLMVTKNSKVMPGVSDEMLNKIYNLADIGVNTSMGEGWGLPAFEHAATMTPQLVPNHSACAELWSDIGIVYDILDQPHVGPRLNAEFRVPDVNSLVRAFEAAYDDWKSGGKNLRNLAEKAYETISKYEYSWDYAAERFDEIFRNVL